MKPHTRKTPAAMPHPFGWRTRTEYALSADRLVSLRAHAGDLLRSEEGEVWVTFEGQSQDVFLKPGQVHELAADSRLHASGFRAARMSVVGQGSPEKAGQDRVVRIVALLRARVRLIEERIARVSALLGIEDAAQGA